MRLIFEKIRHSYLTDRPIIRLYVILYFSGIFIGSFSAYFLRDYFSSEVQLIFNVANTPGFWSIYIQQLIFVMLLFFIGFTAVGAPFLTLFPLYKGFSIGLLVSLSVILFKLKGLLLGFIAFAPQSLYYSFLCFFLCYSSAKLSISLSELIRGSGRNHGSRKALISHFLCTLIVVILCIPGSLWEYRIVPHLLEFY